MNYVVALPNLNEIDIFFNGTAYYIKTDSIVHKIVVPE